MRHMHDIVKTLEVALGQAPRHKNLPCKRLKRHVGKNMN